MEGLIILLLFWLLTSLGTSKKKKEAEEKRRQLIRQRMAEAEMEAETIEPERPYVVQTTIQPSVAPHVHAARTDDVIVEKSYTMSTAEGTTMEGCADLAGVRMVSQSPQQQAPAAPPRWQSVIRDVPSAIVAAEILRRPAANRAYARRGRI